MNADIVGLMEIENDAPPNSALEELVAALNAAMGAGTYAFINTGVIGTDEIKVALIYKPAAVTPVGAFKTITTATDPRFIDTLNRPSLAQTFQRNANGGAAHGRRQPPQVEGLRLQRRRRPGHRRRLGQLQHHAHERRQGARRLARDRPDRQRRPRLPADRRLQLVHVRGPDRVDHDARVHEPRSAQFGGLDGRTRTCSTASRATSTTGLASSSLAAQATGATDWHINPDEPTVLDYNVEFKTAEPGQHVLRPGPVPRRPTTTRS